MRLWCPGGAWLPASTSCPSPGGTLEALGWRGSLLEQILAGRVEPSLLQVFLLPQPSQDTPQDPISRLEVASNVFQPLSEKGITDMKESSGKRTFWILKEQVACQRSNEPKQNKLLLLKLLL